MMAQEFRYPLTRICLRSGTLTLPLAMLQVFPDDGEIAAHDTLRGMDVMLHVEGRRVSGLEEFFDEHDLEVNDEVVVKVADDGALGITAVKRVRKPDYHRPEVLGRLVDDVVEAGVPMTEGEIRAIHPDLPDGFPLREALEADERLTLHQGRWHSTVALEEERRSAERAAAERARADAARRAEIAAEAERRADAAARAAEQREAERRAEAAAKAAAEHEARREAEREAQREAQRNAQLAAERAAAATAAAEQQEAADDDGGPDQRAEVERRSRAALAERAEEDARAHARRERDARADARAAEREAALGGEVGTGSESFDWNEPVGRGFRFPWQRAKPKAAKSPAEPTPATKDPFHLDRLGEARPSASRPTVVPTPRATLFPGDTALNSASLPPGDPAKTKRAREAFVSFGYRVEGLAHGQLMLHADLGRRNHKVLLHVLPDEQRLDWAALLARRRESGATYLAVVGDHRDLHRLTAPADLARATLWSWAGVERVRDLAGTVMLGPVDLEPHFERDGMFEYGLERFERSVAKRVQEKGVVSSVLTRLAGLRAPAVFVIEDLVGDSDVSRDQIVRVLERLAEAPFHLISKVDNGEFCLRYRVHDALDQVAEYATSLRERLPERQRPRVRGLTDDEAMPALDPIGADDVDFARVEVRSVAARTEAPAERRPPTLRPEQRAPATQPPSATPERGRSAAGAESAQAPVSVTVAAQAPRTRPAPEAPAAPATGQDALFGGGFATGFGDEPEDEIDVSQVIDRKPRGRSRKRG